jgi:hypothetical protein
MSERNHFHLFIEENGTWLLTFFGILGGCMSALTIYFLKSRCSHIRLCYGCVDCIREPLPVHSINVDARPVI